MYQLTYIGFSMSIYSHKLVKINTVLTWIGGYGTFLNIKQTQTWDYIMILNLSDHTNGFSAPLSFLLMDTVGSLCIYHLLTYQVVFHAVFSLFKALDLLLIFYPTDLGIGTVFFLKLIQSSDVISCCLIGSKNLLVIIQMGYLLE